MFRTFAVCIWLLPGAALCCDDSVASLTLRDAIYAHEIDRVETLLNEHQRLFEAGERSAEDTRCLFRHFTKMRPATFEFVEDWRERYPESPFALTAQAWVNYVVSWQFRGNGYAHDIYKGALTAFSELQAVAWAQAEAAYLARPRLIAASDALIKLANPNGKSASRATVLAQVMETDPNEGTLSRAVAQVNSGWGGTWAMGAAMCDEFADRIPGAGADAIIRCKLPLARRFPEHQDWMNETLASGEYPDLDYLRMHYIVRPDATREEAEVALRVMSNERYNATRYLSTYDGLAVKYGLPLMTGIISDRRYAYAEQELEHAPLSLVILDMLSEPRVTSAVSENGQLRISVQSHPSPEAMLDYARRRVQATPYLPDAWTDLLTREMQVGGMTGMAQAEPYRINAIVYSNHSPTHLLRYMTDKVFEYDTLQRARDGELSAEVLTMFDGVDEERDIICPLVRASRIRDSACLARHRPGCDPAAEIDSIIAILEDDAKENGICVGERTLPVEALLFSPMAIESGG